MKRISLLFFAFLLFSANTVLAEESNNKSNYEGNEVNLADHTVEDVLNDFKKENLKIGTIGKIRDVPYTSSLYAESFVSKDQRILANDVEDQIGLVINENEFNSISKDDVYTALNKGMTVFIDANVFTLQKFADYLEYDVFLESEFVSEDGSYESYHFVSQDEKGNLNFGTLVGSESANSENLIESIIYESYLKRANEEIETSPEISPSDSEDFSMASHSPGSHWYKTLGDTSRYFYTQYGQTYERLSGWSIHTSYDQSSKYDYTALAFYWETIPKSSSMYVKQLKLFTNSTNSSTPGVGLERYGPTSQPGSNTVSINFGLSGSGLSFGASWSINRNDLTIANNSNTGAGYMEVIWNFKNSAYAKGTTIQEPGFSYRAWQGASTKSILMMATRHSTYAGFSASDINKTTYYHTVPIKKP